VLSVFALDYTTNPARVLWKTALPCEPCYIHSLAMTQNYVVFVRNVCILILIIRVHVVLTSRNAD